MMPEPICYEYIWLDGIGQLRSKTKICPKLYELPPDWNYDGSSTYQRITSESEVMLYPQVTYRDPIRGYPHKLVICETSDSNCSRRLARKIFNQKPELEPMFGLEQEFFIYSTKTGKPLGWPEGHGYPAPQGDYYCSVGSDTCFGRSRQFIERVMKFALKCGIGLTGFNWEVAPGQAEFQVCRKGIKAADELLLLRYLLMRVGEEYNYTINFDCKPFKDWNGSGLHTNFSTKEIRENDNALDIINDALNRLRISHSSDLKLFGLDNHLRLTGEHETSSTDEFTWGVASRSTSVRIPTSTQQNGKGYFEDRRPGANANPYIITANIYKVTSLEPYTSIAEYYVPKCKKTAELW